MNVSPLNKLDRCIATLALLVAAHGVVNAQNVAKWSWQEPQAKVLPTGDLEWAPKAFEFKAGESVRYIDFESGNDANDGLSKQTPWKHHPWDPNAAGKAKACMGMQTYVFKQGVDYRGELNANESGTEAAPIILTRDPSWGQGPAVICGSEAVTGWKKGADNNLIPEPEKVWYADLNWMPRNVWMVRKKGAVTRIALARTPNWKVSDPDDVKSEWWEWNNPDKPFDNYVTTASGRKLNLGIDTEHLKQPASYYEGATLWTEYGWVMGTPYPTPVEVVNTQKHALGFTGQWGDTPGSYKFIRYCRYFLEDKPQYLDSPGEFWFGKKGDGGRLYLRLPEDQDPNTADVEVARRIHMIESSGMSHVHISGLTFRFPNVYNLTVAPYWASHESIDVDPGCVRLLGSGTDIQITECVFEHVHQAIRLKAVGRQDAIGDVVVSDNVIRYTDNGAVLIADSTTYGDVAPPMGRLYDVKVLRNSFYETGLRPNRFDQGHALEVDYAQTLEVAGNILDRCWGAGIFVFGGKPSGAITDRPFSRMIVHHNKVTDSLLNTCDWGGIETWQGGPSYVYDNISGNPGGYLKWGHMLSPNDPGSSRFGHAYYLDGGFKNYHFNNIAWGKSKDPLSPLGNTAAIQEIISYQNTFFNNTIYNFVVGSRRQAPQAGRDKFLGNIWDGLSSWVFRHADPARTAAAGNAADAGPRRGHYDIASDAYAQNVFHDLSNGFGVLEPSGRWLDNLGKFQDVLGKNNALAAAPGILTDKAPLQDAAAHDFRPAPDSPALNHGVKVFVPWSLYGEVAEWNFYRAPGDPTHLIDEHWNMAPYYVERDGYYTRPTYPLKAVNVAAADYERGPLETWTDGALRFNGRDQYAVLPNKDINRTVDYSASYQPPDWVTVTYPKAMTVGQSCEVQLRLHDVKDGLKLHCDLNWSKKTEAFGGVNTWGGPPKEVKGLGPYKFTLVPQDKPDLGSFVLTIYLSTTGDWKDKTLLATVGVPVGAAEGQTRTVTLSGERVVEQRTVSGADLRNPQIYTSNFLIEAYFKTAQGQKDAVLIQKIDGAGYVLGVNQAGGVTLAATSGGATSWLASRSAVNDGQWHHVIAEADRKAGTFTIYIDGKQDAGGPGLEADASLANDADLYVGGAPNGHYLNGVIDFMRIARGTLADSKTTIGELYAWEFNGPFLYDFTGRKRPAGGGEAGAIDGLPVGDR
jgi:hypothetical protein